MDIGAISNLPSAMMNPVMSAGATNFSPAATGLSPAAMGRMDQLTQILLQFSTAEILSALLLANAGVRHHHPASAETAGLAAMTLAQSIQAASLGSASGYMALPSVAASGIAAGAIAAGAMGAQISVQG